MYPEREGRIDPIRRRVVKALLAVIALVAASAAAAQPAPDPAAWNPNATSGEDGAIVVEGQRLPDDLKDTTLTLVRGRDNRVTFRIRRDGTFVSKRNGLQSDFGRWRVEGDNVCFVGRARGTFCGRGLLNGRLGDRWETLGYDGKVWEASLSSNY
jgi:hypothetical protein